MADLADDAQVCNCNGVCKSTIVDTVKGCKTVSGVMDKTRAGKGCGSCKLLVAQLVLYAAGGAVEEDPSAHYYVPGIPMDKPSLVQAVRAQNLRSVAEIFAALAPNGEEDAKSKMGLASLLKLIWAPTRPTIARHGSSTTGACQHPEGRHLLVISLGAAYHSRAAASHCRCRREVLRANGEAHRRPAHRSARDQKGGPTEGLGRSRDAVGLRIREIHAIVNPWRHQEFCRFGLGDSTRLGVELETRLQGMESPAKMKLSVSGCPRNCAESYVKDVGLVAIEGGRWEIYIGGAAGAHVRKGDVLATVDDAETAKKLTARFIQYYRENAKWLERTYAFVPRIGLDRIMAVVVEDSEGIAERLDAAVQEHVDSHVDPWSHQGPDPVTPGQFRTSLPLEVLPRVPADRAEQLLGGAW